MADTKTPRKTTAKVTSTKGKVDPQIKRAVEATPIEPRPDTINEVGPTVHTPGS